MLSKFKLLPQKKRKPHFREASRCCYQPFFATPSLTAARAFASDKKRNILFPSFVSPSAAKRPLEFFLITALSMDSFFLVFMQYAINSFAIIYNFFKCFCKFSKDY